MARWASKARARARIFKTALCIASFLQLPITSVSVSTFCLFAAINTHAEDRTYSSVMYRIAAVALALSPEQAGYGYTARIRGVVTESAGKDMGIHDSTSGIWVYWNGADSYSSSDELEVQGVISPGMFAPVINAASVRKLGRSPLPIPKPVTFEQLRSGNMDGQYISIVGVVRSVGIQNAAPRSERVVMKLKVDGGFLVTTLRADDRTDADRMVDATVKVTGTAMCSKNNNRQIIAPTLAASSLRNVTVLRSRSADLFSEPLTPIGTNCEIIRSVAGYLSAPAMHLKPTMRGSAFRRIT